MIINKSNSNCGWVDTKMITVKEKVLKYNNLII